jgi:hypothetical protein
LCRRAEGGVWAHASCRPAGCRAFPPTRVRGNRRLAQSSTPVHFFCTSFSVHVPPPRVHVSRAPRTGLLRIRGGPWAWQYRETKKAARVLRRRPSRDERWNAAYVPSSGSEPPMRTGRPKLARRRDFSDGFWGPTHRHDVSDAAAGVE